MGTTAPERHERIIAWEFYNDTVARGFWFRVLGVGLSIDNMRPLFSERMGYRRKLRIGKWGMEFLGRPTR